MNTNKTTNTFDTYRIEIIKDIISDEVNYYIGWGYVKSLLMDIRTQMIAGDPVETEYAIVRFTTAFNIDLENAFISEFSRLASESKSVLTEDNVNKFIEIANVHFMADVTNDDTIVAVHNIHNTEAYAVYSRFIDYIEMLRVEDGYIKDIDE